jgi:hypothetical protein
MITILENGEELSVKLNETISGMIYRCDECGFYHCNEGITLDMIELLTK